MATAGKVALVTGASRGIGRGIALALVKEGAKVVITGRHKASLDTANAEINAAANAGGSCRTHVCDHGNDAEVEKLFDEIFSKEGCLDILVNNAVSGADVGWGKVGPFWEKPLSHWDYFHHVGLRSHYTALVLAARHWVKTGTPECKLVVMTSAAAGAGFIFDTAYGVAKMGVDRLAADSAKELKEHGVAVVSIWPGAVRAEASETDPTAGNPAAFPDFESVEMTGRGVVSLACDPDVMRWSGKVVMTPELAEEYGFTDIDGKIHWGPNNFMKKVRTAMKEPPSHWQLPAECTDPSDLQGLLTQPKKCTMQ